MIESTAPLAALLSPGLFYAGLVAVGIPILIHLLAKRRFKRVRWAAMEFLLLAEKQNRRRVNIQQLILLALRCLAVFLLGLMLARPYLSPGELANVLGAEIRLHRIILLDDSFSLSYTDGAASTFDQAQAAAGELLAWLYADAPGCRVTFLRTSDPAGRVLDGAVLTEAVLREAQSLIKRMTVSEVPASFADLAAALHSELTADPDDLSAAIYIISDFQKKDWLPARLGSESTSPLAVFRNWPEQRALSITLIAVGTDHRSNAAITSLGTAQPQWVANIENRMKAVIINFCETARESLEMSVFVNDAAQESVRVPAIQPGESVEVGFSVTFPTEGFAAVSAELPGDALGLDDRRTAVAEVQSALRVLIVNGEPGGAMLLDEAAFLRTALHPGGDTHSGFQVSVVEEGELDSLDLGSFHVVILANVDSLAEEAATRIEDHVRSGGGLAVFLGDLADAEAYDARLGQESEGLLPCRLGSLVTTAQAVRPPGLIDADPTHPVSRVLSGLENPVASNLAFWRYFACLPTESHLQVERDDEMAGRVLARFDDAERHPAIIEKSFGRGKVVLFASSADTEWNNWAQWPSYVIAMQELGYYLARPATASNEVLAGRSIYRKLAPERYQPEFVIRPSTYPSDPQAVVQARVDEDGAYEVVWPNTARTGIYHLVLDRLDGGVEDVPVAVNPDPSESDLESCAEADLRQSAAGVEVSYVTHIASLAGGREQARRELWPALVMGIVALLMVEQTLACWFGRAS